MFNVGDIIRHKKMNTYYIVIRKNIFGKSDTNLITFEAVRIDDDRETIIMHYPLMTSYFEIIKSPIDTEK